MITTLMILRFARHAHWPLLALDAVDVTLCFILPSRRLYRRALFILRHATTYALYFSFFLICHKIHQCNSFSRFIFPTIFAIELACGHVL